MKRVVWIEKAARKGRRRTKCVEACGRGMERGRDVSGVMKNIISEA